MDHLIHGVPASSNVMKKLQIWNLDGLLFLILEPFLVVAVTYDLTKVVTSFTRGPNGTDSAATQSNGITSNSLLKGLSIWVRGRKSCVSRSKISVVISERLVSKGVGDVGYTDGGDVREAHNIPVFGVERDISFVKENFEVFKKLSVH